MLGSAESRRSSLCQRGHRSDPLGPPPLNGLDPRARAAAHTQRATFQVVGRVGELAITVCGVFADRAGRPRLVDQGGGQGQQERNGGQPPLGLNAVGRYVAHRCVIPDPQRWDQKASCWPRSGAKKLSAHAAVGLTHRTFASLSAACLRCRDRRRP